MDSKTPEFQYEPGSLGDILFQASKGQQTKPTENKPMIIIAQLYYRKGQKIEAIKIVREFAHVGLKLAKDVVEEAEKSFGSGVRVRLTAEQFGKATALVTVFKNQENLGLYLTALAIEKEGDAQIFDFTK